MDLSAFFEKFDDLYSERYEYEWDDEMGQLFLSYSTEHNCILVGLTIDIDKNSFSIYHAFLYEDHYGPFSMIEICKDEILFEESVKRIYKCEPEFCCDDGLGCPFLSNQIGFFNVPFSWEKLNSHIEMMVQANQLAAKLSFHEISLEHDDFLRIEQCRQSLFEKLKVVAPSLCHKHISDTPEYSNSAFRSVLAYTSRFNTALVGVGMDNLQTITTLQECSLAFYRGFRYFITNVNNKNYTYDQNLVSSIITAFEEVDEECDVEAFLNYYIDTQNRLVLICGEMWAVICFFESDSCEKHLTFEKNKLKKLQQEFINIAPEFFWNRSFDFMTLNDQQFEALCRDLLQSMNYKHIQVHGKTRTPDGGVDITAEEEYQTASGPKIRRWLFQCKHTKKQIDRKDLSEVRYLLKEHNADCYGLFYSGFFTPATLKRMQTIRDEDHVMIQGWDHNNLELEISRDPSLSAKYFGV